MRRDVLLASVAGLLLMTCGAMGQTALDLPQVTVAQPRAKPKPVAPVRTARPRAPRAAPAATPVPAPAQPLPATPPGPRFNEPVTTALQGLPQAVQQASGGPATVLTNDRIARDNNAQVGDAMFTRPGLIGNTFAPGASRPIVRGLDAFRVGVQENGIGSHDATDLGEDHGVPQDPTAAQKIELIRGPGTLRYSSQALGGIVESSNTRIPDVLPPAGIHGEIRGAGTTVDNGFVGSMTADAVRDGTVVHVDAFGRKSDDYRIPGGVQPNTAMQASGAAGGVTKFYDQGFHGISVQHYQSLYRIPGIEAAEERKRIDLKSTRLSSRGEHRPDAGPFSAIRYWFGATQYRHDEIALDEILGADAVKATFTNSQQEVRVEAAHVPLSTPFGLLTGVVGADAGNRDVGSAGEAGGLLAPATVRRSAAYVYEQLRFLPTWSLVGAARIEQLALAGTSTTYPSFVFDPANPDPANASAARHFVPISVSGALVKDLPWATIATLTLERKERAPGPLELFARGAHEALGTFEIGNLGLTKEVMNAAEIGFKRLAGDWRFEANAYWRRFNGFIFRNFTGNTCGEDYDTCIAGPGEEFQQVAYSQRDANFRGVELYSQLDLTPLPVIGGVFGVEGQFDFVRATFVDGTNVPRIPPMRLGGGAYWRDGNWLARVLHIRAFAQIFPGQNETPTPGYDLLKAELSYTRRIADPFSPFASITLGVFGDNLLNDDIRNSVSFRKDEVLLAGRNLRFFAVARF